MAKSVSLLKRGEDSSFIGALLNKFEVQSSYGSYYKYAYTYARNNGQEKKKIKFKKTKEEKVSEVET
jgi:hypothetical protein